MSGKRKPKRRVATLNDQARYIINRAYKLISAGWCKGSHATRGGHSTRLTNPGATNFCLTGAIHRATLDLKLNKQARFKAFDVLDLSLPNRGCGFTPLINKILYPHSHLIAFNDAKTTRKQDIKDLLLKAATTLKNESKAQQLSKDPAK